MHPFHEGAQVSFERLLALRHEAARTPQWAAATDNRAGGFAGRKRGSGLDIHDLRQFAEGDDLRHVDASTTARTGRLHVRTFHEDQDRTALLIADFRGPMLWGTRGRLRSVAAAEALALAGWRTVDSGGSVGLLAVRDADTDYVAPQLRERAMLRIAGALERSHRLALATTSGSHAAGAAQSLDVVLERVARLATRGAAIICATGLDGTGPGFESVASSLARRGRLSFLLVQDAVETAPPKGLFPYLSDEGTARWGRFPAEESGPPASARRRLLESLGAEVQTVAAADLAITASAETL